MSPSLGAAWASTCVRCVIFISPSVLSLALCTLIPSYRNSFQGINIKSWALHADRELLLSGASSSAGAEVHRHFVSV